jgi:hypothetical protein
VHYNALFGERKKRGKDGISERRNVEFVEKDQRESERTPAYLIAGMTCGSHRLKPVPLGPKSFISTHIDGRSP